MSHLYYRIVIAENNILRLNNMIGYVFIELSVVVFIYPIYLKREAWTGNGSVVDKTLKLDACFI